MALLLLLCTAGALLAMPISEIIQFQDNSLSLNWAIILIVLYILLMSIPFMPAIEIGWMLMIIFGAEGVLFVYLCTLLALLLSFSAGRILPVRIFSGILEWLHLEKAKNLVLRVHKLRPTERMNILMEASPSRFSSSLLKHRYLLIGVLLNIPGNMLIGGGGGIGVLAGMSSVYSFAKYMLLISVAILPVPIVMVFFPNMANILSLN